MNIENLIHGLKTEIKNIDELKRTQALYPEKSGPFEFYFNNQTGELQSTYFPGQKSGELIEIYFDKVYGAGFSSKTANNLNSSRSQKALKTMLKSVDVFERCYMFRKTSSQEVEELLEEMRDCNIMKRNYNTLKSIFDDSFNCYGAELGVNDCTGELISDEHGNTFEMEVEKTRDKDILESIFRNHLTCCSKSKDMPIVLAKVHDDSGKIKEKDIDNISYRRLIPNSSDMAILMSSKYHKK